MLVWEFEEGETHVGVSTAQVRAPATRPTLRTPGDTSEAQRPRWGWDGKYVMREASLTA